MARKKKYDPVKAVEKKYGHIDEMNYAGMAALGRRLGISTERTPHTGVENATTKKKTPGSVARASLRAETRATQAAARPVVRKKSR